MDEHYIYVEGEYNKKEIWGTFPLAQDWTESPKQVGGYSGFIRVWSPLHNDRKIMIRCEAEDVWYDQDPEGSEYVEPCSDDYYEAESGVVIDDNTYAHVDGTYHSKPMRGTFKVVKPWQDSPSKSDGFITVIHPELEKKIRIRCHEDDVIYTDSVTESSIEIGGEEKETAGKTKLSHAVKDFLANEPEDAAMERIRHSFEMVEKTVEAVGRGIMTSLVVKGPAGVGKSYNVIRSLEQGSFLRKVGGEDSPFEIISGRFRALALYQKLYDFCQEGKVLVFDDCDSILYDEDCLNILKAALDSTDKRVIHWGAKSYQLEQNDIPPKFEFKGSVIFITNTDFAAVKSQKIAPHLEAIMSRSHYMDMGMEPSDVKLRIKQIVNDGMMDSYGFSDETVNDILDYVIRNEDNFNEFTLRTVKKVADLVKASPKEWKDLAENTLMKKNVRLQKYVERQQAKANAEATT